MIGYPYVNILSFKLKYFMFLTGYLLTHSFKIKNLYENEHNYINYKK